MRERSPPRHTPVSPPTYTGQKSCEDTRGSCHLQGKERDLWWKQPRRHPDLGLQSPDSEKINSCCVSCRVWCLLWWSTQTNRELTKKTPFKRASLRGEGQAWPHLPGPQSHHKMRILRRLRGALAGGEQGENIPGRRSAGAQSSPALPFPESSPTSAEKAAFMCHMCRWVTRCLIRPRCDALARGATAATFRSVTVAPNWLLLCDVSQACAWWADLGERGRNKGFKTCFEACFQARQ